MKPPSQIHKGKLIRNEDGQLCLRTKFSSAPQAADIDVPIDELLEDFENLGVEMTIYPRNAGDPIWKGLVENWDTEIEKTVDPDYKHCSDVGRERFLDMKLGLMVHWGMYSHLGSSESWAAYAKNAPMWFMDIYYTLWQMWNPTDFDAEKWAQLVKRAGLQFIQVTSKHCEGFALWDTKTKVRVPKRIGYKTDFVIYPVEEIEINYSVMDSPFKRDVIKELSTAFRKHNLGFSIYYSHWDWEDPNFRWDEGNRCYDPAYNPKENPKEWNAFIQRERQQLVELFSHYGPIDQVFFDCTWFGLAWKEMKALAKELRKLQPDCMFSDRGFGPYGDFTSPERWIPNDAGTGDPRVKGRLWELCDTIGTHWSYVPDEKFKTKEELLHNIIDVVAKGGTFVLDTGPMPNGWFSQESVDLLETIGRWLHVNGEGIYATRSYTPYHEGDNTYFTRSKDNHTVYLFHIGWSYPKLETSCVKPKKSSKIYMLGISDPIPWHMEGLVTVLEIPESFNGKIPCEYAFCYKIEI
jgi:alpha-L-fucosidase